MLSICGTPIGNLSDASPRLVETLSRADLVCCEDTRVTSKLLAHFGIHVPLMRCDENVIEARIPELLERLAAGERVAFVSDAGMPCISDPGQRLVDAALDAGISVEIVPGPSAVSSALARSGLAGGRFFFEGFLPRKEGAARARLEWLRDMGATFVLFESPKRVAKTLARIAEFMPLRRVALVRELTKLHEEVLRGNAAELAKALSERGELRGECVICVEEGDGSELAVPLQVPLDEAICAGLAEGEAKNALAKRLSHAYGRARSDVYARVLELAQ
ncbi:MAG TPA: 16S rRNA (cytidine(1402)-2'-O)-methyltransferase [Atopobiaceae bacterium]|nr:16S rRNA (cytidine(1402)-2'-O)-methyltransferase [Atopobiaceae bacterium]